MFVTLWEFEVKSGSEELLERVYGAEGDWVRLFGRDARDRGTRLLREVGRARVYVTVDGRESREAYEEFRQKFAAAYAQVEERSETLTIAEREVT